VCAAVAVIVAATVAVAAPALARRGAAEKPLSVKTSWLNQGGRQLYWHLQTNSPFSVTRFRRERRSLCLLIEGAKRGRLSGRVCLIAAAHHRQGPRLVYQTLSHGHAGPGRFVGKVTRSSRVDLLATFQPSEIGRGYRWLRWQVLSSVAPPDCSGAECHTLYPRRPRLLRLHTPRLVGCVPRGSSLVFSGPSSRKEIALTFDDGPWNDPPTSQFLHVLEHYHAVATFFEIGNQISSYDPGGVQERRMLADGDMIGDHTWTHPDMTTLSPAQQRSELQLTINAIKHETGFRTCLWRPPYEAFNSQVDSVARSMGLLTINYDVDTQDWKEPGTATIYQRAVDGAHNGAIILQHFGGGPRQETLQALPEEITTLRSRGYRLVTVPQLLGLRLIYK
jgi:peptidoglycan-N-acetylglucosamine deacetylase